MKNDVENNQIPKKKKKRGSGFVFFLVVVLVIIGVVYENSEERIFVDSRVMLEDLCDLGTYKCAFTLTKNEDVQNENLAFVFIEGYETPSSYTDFYSLRNYFSKYGDCLSFDKSGFGYSTSTSIERSITNLVYELETLISKELPDKQIVLVAHDVGSIEAIAYAQKYSSRVEAIVFLDAGSPEYYSESNEILKKVFNVALSSLRIVGLNRLLGKFGIILPLFGERDRYSNIPDAYKEFDLESYYYEMGNSSTWDYVDMMNENAGEVLNGEKLDMPILCISGDRGSNWDNVQKELALWSSNSTSVKIEGGDHYIHWSNEEETTQSIQSFLVENEIVWKIN